MKNKKLLISIFLLGILYFIVNQKWGITIPCFFHEITGLYCPGCGITRMIISLFHLEFYQAFRYNPLIFILLIAYIVYKLVNIKIKVKVPKFVTYILLVITIIFGILRNTTMFNYLKPTELNINCTKTLVK